MSKPIKLGVVFILIASIVISAVFAAQASKAERNILYNDEYIYEVIDESYVIIHYYRSENEDVTIPQYINSLPVKSIESLAFYGSAAKNVVISEGITDIESEAFIFAEELESVSLPSTLEYMGEAIFRGCTKLRSVTFSDSKAPLGEFMFYGCTSLEEVSLPRNIYTLSYGAFAYCESLRNIELSDIFGVIASYCFYASGLEQIKLPPYLSYIGSKAFAETKNLQDVLCEYPDRVTVASDAFLNSNGEFPFAETDTVPPVDIPTEPEETTTPYFPPPVEPTNSIEVSTDASEDPPKPPTDPEIVPDGSCYFGDYDGFMLTESIRSSETKEISANSKSELMSLAWNVRFAGDANCDDMLNIKDATAVQLYVASIELSSDKSFSFKNADVNRDGNVSIKDATLIRKVLAHILVDFP